MGLQASCLRGSTGPTATTRLFWGVAVYAILTVVMAAGTDEQSLVLFYAVSVFLTFMAGLAAMVAFS